MRFNGSHRVFDNLKVGANIAYVDTDGGFITSRNSTDGLLLGAWRSPPNFDNRPYLDPVSGLHRTYRFPNPAAGSEQRQPLLRQPVLRGQRVVQQVPGRPDLRRHQRRVHGRCPGFRFNVHPRGRLFQRRADPGVALEQLEYHGRRGQRGGRGQRGLHQDLPDRPQPDRDRPLSS